MASAQMLGALGVSFTGIHLSMSALGFLLNPVVFASISVGAGLVALASSIKSGDKFLGMSMTALDQSWDKAYQCAHRAFRKVVLKPSPTMIVEWYRAVGYFIRVRVDEISRIEVLCNRITENPDRFRRESCLLGWAVCVPVIAVLLMFDANSVSIALLSLSIAWFVSERRQSASMIRVITELPRLQAELRASNKNGY